MRNLRLITAILQRARVLESTRRFASPSRTRSPSPPPPASRSLRNRRARWARLHLPSRYALISVTVYFPIAPTVNGGNKKSESLHCPYMENGYYQLRQFSSTADARQRAVDSRAIPLNFQSRRSAITIPQNSQRHETSVTSRLRDRRVSRRTTRHTQRAKPREYR